MGEEGGRAIADRNEEAEEEADDEAGEIYFVGKDALAQVGEDEDDDDRGEDDPFESSEGEAESEKAEKEEQAGEKFDGGIHGRDTRAALPAFAAEDEIAEDRNVVIGANGGAAVSAGGGGKNDGFSGG